jgi:hypothetical protein
MKNIYPEHKSVYHSHLLFPLETLRKKILSNTTVTKISCSKWKLKQSDNNS